MRGRARWIAVAAVLLAVAALALTVGLPDPVTLRERARALGVWGPLAFLVVHALVTTTPVPRTTFTISAGLLFGPWVGVAVCLVGSTASAVLGFLLSRRLGGRAVTRLGEGRVRALERRLSHRGLVTVISTRLVPALPFALLNYSFGVTTVRMPPYLVGTAVGLVPGTVAVVLAGDAVTGQGSPTTLAVFVVSGLLGVVGVVWSSRRLPGERRAAGNEA